MTLFRAGTYNVHKCKGTDWRVSPQRVAAVMCELNADVLAAQEVLLSQAEAMAAKTQLPFVFGAARTHDHEPYGNAIFSRHGFIRSHNHDVSVAGREPRCCLQASIELPGRDILDFYAVHLGTSFLERRAQATRMKEILGGRSENCRRIVAGDFNEWTRGLATRTLSSCLNSADIELHLNRRRTYPGLLPLLHLDHIYYDPLFHLRGMHLHRTKLALLASDHLPVLADFEVRPATFVL